MKHLQAYIKRTVGILKQIMANSGANEKKKGEYEKRKAILIDTIAFLNDWSGHYSYGHTFVPATDPITGRSIGTADFVDRGEIIGIIRTSDEWTMDQFDSRSGGAGVPLLKFKYLDVGTGSRDASQVPHALKIASGLDGLYRSIRILTCS